MVVVPVWLLTVLMLLPIALAAMLIFTWILLPGPARTLLKLRLRKRRIPLFVAGREGIVKLVAAEPTPEGTLKVGSGRGEAHYFIARDRLDKDKASRYFSLKRYILDGLARPVFFAYAGKAIAMNPHQVLRLNRLDINDAAAKIPIMIPRASVTALIRVTEAKAYAEAKALPVKSLLILGTLVIVFTFAAVILHSVFG